MCKSICNLEPLARKLNESTEKSFFLLFLFQIPFPQDNPVVVELKDEKQGKNENVRVSYCVMKTDGSEFNLNCTHFQINLMDQNSKYNTL